MSFENWLEIGLGVLFVIALMFGVKWQQTKTFLKELAEALTATSAALEDDDITSSERTKLLKEWAEVVTAARALISR